MDEEIFVKLRYCFAAGYTMPQFCVDKGIKKPLFVLNRSFECFLKEIYAQFQYDERVSAQFCFIDGTEKRVKLSVEGGFIGGVAKIKHISEMNFDDFDKIVFLTAEKSDTNDPKIISFEDLQKFFTGRTFVDIPLLNFLQRYPKVKFILSDFPNRISRYKGGIKFDSNLKSANYWQKILLEDKAEKIKTPLDKFGYTREEIIELFDAKKAKKNLNGTTSLLDDEHPLLQISGGKRMTAYQPETYRNKIYFLGPCHYFGRNAPFDKTIESYLQQMINENNLPYRVENEGQDFAARYQDIFHNLNALNPSPGDIIFFYFWNLHSIDDAIPFFSVNDAFDPPQDYRKIFCTKAHVNELGYKILAEKYFEYLTANNFFRDTEFNYPPPPAPYFHRYGIPPQYEQGGSQPVVSEELEAYKQQLRTKKVPIGAIVMNCNPFTLGHRYLIKHAAAQVVKLYIFVVEEDKSEFPFADRIKLVKRGVEDLPNVEVLPSGKFIISQTTFSGYFSKAELQDVAVDSSEDVEIFGREIAPTLGITIRFAGEEPLDNVTRQYNETMKKILPRYGVEFREIPRKNRGGEVISASRVRKALKEGDFDTIKNLVPETTLKYLRGLYSRTQGDSMALKRKK